MPAGGAEAAGVGAMPADGPSGAADALHAAARADRAGSGLAQQRVEKSVLIVRCARERRQELAASMGHVGGKREGFAQRVGVPGEKASTRASFSSRKSSRSRTASARRARGRARARRGAAPAAARSSRCRAARRSHLPSGWRRTTPDAVHGTSARMRSNGSAVPPRLRRRRHRPPRRARAPPASCSRARFSRTRGRRASSLSSATTSTSASSARCVVLPPGRRAGVEHAHAGATRSSGAASCAPRSCTANQPSAKPGSSVTGRGGSTITPRSPAARAPMPAAANAREQCLARASSRD